MAVIKRARVLSPRVKTNFTERRQISRAAVWRHKEAIILINWGIVLAHAFCGTLPTCVVGVCDVVLRASSDARLQK